MNCFRLVGLLLVVLLSACDAQNSAAPAPKVAAETKSAVPVETTVKVAADGVPGPVVAPAPFKELERDTVHELAPNVAVVPVMIARQQAPEKKPAVVKVDKTAQEKGKPAAVSSKEHAPVASKSKPSAHVEQGHLPHPSLDLTLPSSIAQEVQPAGKVEPIAHKSVLPQMFGEKKAAKDSPFQLNGRLLSNEMQLQLRNEARQNQVDGAAVEFEFRQ